MIKAILLLVTISLLAVGCTSNNPKPSNAIVPTTFKGQDLPPSNVVKQTTKEELETKQEASRSLPIDPEKLYSDYDKEPSKWAEQHRGKIYRMTVYYLTDHYDKASKTSSVTFESRPVPNQRGYVQLNEYSSKMNQTLLNSTRKFISMVYDREKDKTPEWTIGGKYIAEVMVSDPPKDGTYLSVKLLKIEKP